MSITSDLRGYADTAIEQGKQVVGQVQTQVTGLTGTARTNVTELTNRATVVVTDLRTQAEKTLNVEALRSAVEPYLAQAKQYRTTVSERAEGLLGSVTSDKRVAKVVSTAESLSGVVVETFNERLVKPVSSLAGRAPAAAPATKASRPAATRPAAKKASAKAPAKSAPATKPGGTTARTSTARKSAAKRTGTSAG